MGSGWGCTMYRAFDWGALRLKLPLGKEKRAERERLFKRCDINGNGVLSLAEVDKGMRDEFRLPAIFSAKPVLMRAFQAAKASVQGENTDDDAVELSEFERLLEYLRQVAALQLKPTLAALCTTPGRVHSRPQWPPRVAQT